jgi:heat shock protein HslJ
MKKALLLALAIGSSALLAACSGGAAGSTLTGGTWYLTSGTQTAPAWQWAVPPAEQASYTITFNADGNFGANADCNVAGGTYETSGTDGLTITPATSTMAYCGDGSLDTLYVHALSTTTTYKIANGELTLTLADGGTLMFTSTAPTASAEPEPSPVDVPAGSPGEQALTGWDWSLVAITEEVPAFQGVVPEDQQENYQIAFTEDGTFSAKADCNQVSGEYETEDAAASSGPLTITPGPSTLAFCPEGSLGDLFVIGLSNAVSYEITADGLTITLGNGGTLQFQ